MVDVNDLKKLAAERAVNFVESGMVIGLGTGSTAMYAEYRISRLLETGQLINITDQENFILDYNFGPISNPERLALKLSQRAGIVEHWLFLGLASDVIAAGQNGVRQLTGKNA